MDAGLAGGTERGAGKPGEFRFGPRGMRAGELLPVQVQIGPLVVFDQFDGFTARQAGGGDDNSGFHGRMEACFA